MSSIAKRPDGRWRARYRDAENRELSKHFARKVDAQRWLDEVTTSVVTGTYVDPRAGRIRFRDQAEAWRLAQVHRPSTRAHVETMLRRHAYPTFGDRQLSSILPSEVQAWVTRLSATLAPATVGVVHGLVSATMNAAVRDRRIHANPCEGTSLPATTSKRVTPLALAVVEQLAADTPPQLRVAVTLAASTGMRQGEVLGLTVDRVDFLRRTVTADRQMMTVAGREPFLAPAKTKASNRTVPLPQVAVDELGEHLRAFRADPVALTWETPEGTPVVAVRLMFADDGRPWSRQNFGRAWHRGLRAASDCPKHRTANRDSKADCVCIVADFHELRHFYASLLIRHGESVKTVQARLGHASAAETLDTYSHLWPDSDDRTREAVDTAFGSTVAGTSPADYCGLPAD